MRISTRRAGKEIRAGAITLRTRATVRTLALMGDPLMRVLAPRAMPDPYPEYERIRARGPMSRHPIGLYLTADHAISRAALSDPRLGVGPATQRGGIDWNVLSGDEERLIHPLEESLLVLDPPEHTALRRAASPLFAPHAVRDLAPRIEKVVSGILDEVERRERFDLVGDFSRRIPIQVICELFGIPDADHATFVRWGTVLSDTLDGIRTFGERRAVRSVLAEMTDFLRTLVGQRRGKPGDDVLSRLAAAEPDGRPVEERALIALVGTLLIAGFETTVNVIAGAAVELMRRPHTKAVLVDDPGCAAEVVEETLRFEPPVQVLMRCAREPVTLGGAALPAGAMLAIVVAGANRDPAVFADPHRFDPQRTNNRDHLAFSSGAHYCLGAGLARLEAEVALRRLFTRMPRLEMTGEPHLRRTRNIRGHISVPVRVGPR
ncbi:cytochrome P450 [Streptomyces sp. NPDC047108]|uniref:cytochrome P450 n=1 Tax=Streptomyces sp. NPDC047108 TaxID=3155025 RepID=UPI0033F18011